MKASTRSAFLALIVAQAAHSLEEYVSRLHEVFEPARFASSWISSNPDLGFAVLNIAVLAFGLWCYFARVRPGHPSAAAWVWPWIVVELVNGSVHCAMVVVRWGYFPGAVTAPILLSLALLLAGSILQDPSGRVPE